jgi:hypothetical protein
MKLIPCLLLFVGLSNFANGQYQNGYGEGMQYVKNKGVLYNKQIIKKPRHLKPIITAKSNQELTELFKKYRRTQTIQQIIARVRDFGMTYSVLNVLGQPQIQVVPIIMAITGAGGAELLRRPTRYALKDLVEKYNDLVLLEKLELERELSINGK